MLTCKHSCACPSANATLIHPFQGCKAIASIDTRLASLIELAGEDVQHQLAVALSVDMPMGILIQEAPQLGGINKVPVVCEANSIRAVHVKGLRFRVRAAASRRVSKVAEAHEARELRDAGAVVEDLGCHSVALALVEAAARGTGDDACGILPAVLEQVERIVDFNGGRC
jgi:hypothetical protein